MSKKEKFLEICKEYNVEEVWINFDNPFGRDIGDLYETGDLVVVVCPISFAGKATSKIFNFFLLPFNEDDEERYITELNLWVTNCNPGDSVIECFNKRRCDSVKCIYRMNTLGCDNAQGVSINGPTKMDCFSL